MVLVRACTPYSIVPARYSIHCTLYRVYIVHTSLQESSQREYHTKTRIPSPSPKEGEGNRDDWELEADIAAEWEEREREIPDEYIWADD